MIKLFSLKLLLKLWKYAYSTFVSIGRVKYVVFSQLSPLILTKRRLFRDSVEDISRADLRCGLAFGCGERSPALSASVSPATGDGRRAAGFCEGETRFV